MSGHHRKPKPSGYQDSSTHNDSHSFRMRMRRYQRLARLHQKRVEIPFTTVRN